MTYTETVQPSTALWELCAEVSTTCLRIQNTEPEVCFTCAATRDLYFLTDKSRSGDGTRPPGQTLVSSPSLPLPFSGDEHVALDGVDQPLLPPRTALSPHHASWSPAIQNPVYWPSGGFDAQYQLQAPVSSNSPIQAIWAPASPEAGTHLAATVCSFDCEVHTEAYHDALVLLNRRNHLPSQFIHGWQSTRTDEIMSWFVQQEYASSSSSLVDADGQVHQPALPTRQDGEMLRVCK